MKTINPKPPRSLALRSVLIAAACNALLVEPSLAATLTITNLADSGPGTLRQTIAEAAPGDTIEFAVTGTIKLVTGPVVVDRSLTIVGPGAANLALDGGLTNRLLNIASGPVELSGLRFLDGFASGNGGAISNAAKLTVMQCVFSNNFSVNHGGAIFSDGDLTVRDCTFARNYTLDVGDGGAIHGDGSISVADSSIQDCIAVSGGGLQLGWPNTASRSSGEVRRTIFTGNRTDADGEGGAIANWGTLVLADCIFLRNVGSGSAIGNIGTITITNCNIQNGDTRGDWPSAGGVKNDGNGQLVDSRVSGNFGYLGGGVFNTGNLVVRRSTIEGNHALYSGQGIANYGGNLTLSDSAVLVNGSQFLNSGGGIFVFSGNVTLTNCTLSGNSGSTGAGIENFGGTVRLDSCTVAGNAASGIGRGLYNVGDGIFSIRNSIVAGNTALFSANTNTDVAGSFISLGYNLVGASDGSTGFTNGLMEDLVGTAVSPMDAKLGLLADHGGPTRTHALRFDSPALDAGHSGNLVADQRGRPRPIDDPAKSDASGGDGCDIGAYEADPELRFMFIEKSGADIRLQFNTVLGRNYRLERKDNLDNSWSTVSNNLPGTGGTVPLLDSGAAGEPRRFYRAVQLP
jgi:predicted outer membrane repeat protein